MCRNLALVTSFYFSNSPITVYKLLFLSNFWYSYLFDSETWRHRIIELLGTIGWILLSEKTLKEQGGVGWLRSHSTKTGTKAWIPNHLAAFPMQLNSLAHLFQAPDEFIHTANNQMYYSLPRINSVFLLKIIRRAGFKIWSIMYLAVFFFLICHNDHNVHNIEADTFVFSCSVKLSSVHGGSSKSSL